MIAGTMPAKNIAPIDESGRDRVDHHDELGGRIGAMIAGDGPGGGELNGIAACLHGRDHNRAQGGGVG